jgi:hypothetical protein
MVVVLSILGYVFTRNVRFVVVGAITVAAVVVYFLTATSKDASVKEGFTEIPERVDRTAPTTKNPMMNVLLSEYKDDPDRKKALEYDDETHALINEKVKSKVIATVGDPRIFRGMNNDVGFENSMRNFYTTPNTRIPNDQEGFGKFCYGDMVSSKEGNEAALLRNGARIGPISV